MEKTKTLDKQIPEAMMQECMILFKTKELIEMLAKAEIKEKYIFNSAEITRAFTETNCKPFSRADIDFIKTYIQSEKLQAASEKWQKHAKEKKIELVKKEIDTYNTIRQNIKAQFEGLIFYKD